MGVNYEIFIDLISNIVFAKTLKGTIPIGINFDKETGNFESIENIEIGRASCRERVSSPV